MTEAFLHFDWVWDRSYEDYEPSPYDGTYSEE
jgi:hypothetical protein